MRTNRPASKLHIFPYFLDLVEDNVRNRCIFPLCALALYVLLTITIIVSETSVDHHIIIKNKTKSNFK